MDKYQLRCVENERNGDVHWWITKNGKSMDFEDVFDELVSLAEEVATLKGELLPKQ